MINYAIQKVIGSCLCGLLIASCTPLSENWLVPDRMVWDVNTGRYDTIGATWMGGGDRFSTIEGEQWSVGVAFEYDIKTPRTEIVGLEEITAALQALTLAQAKQSAPVVIPAPKVEVQVAAPVIPPAMVTVNPVVKPPDVIVKVEPKIEVLPAEVKPVIQVVPDVKVVIPEIKVTINEAEKADTTPVTPPGKDVHHHEPGDPHEGHGFYADVLDFIDRLINGSIAAIINFLLVIFSVYVLSTIVWKYRSYIPFMRGKDDAK